MQHVTISVVVPVRNEEHAIRRCLDAILANTVQPLEILVVDAESEDETANIVRQYAASDGRVRLLSNPKRIIPAALNTGWLAARGNVIVRVDGHAIISPNYLERVELNLSGGDYQGTGGRKDPVAASAVGKVIAAAMSSRWGIGNSRYHYASGQEDADHVPFGAYPRAVIEELGGWNERFLVNQDFEFDYRLRKNGGRILFDSEMYSQWACSANLRDLAHQYRRYGRGKFGVAVAHPRSLKARHLAPPVGVLVLCATVLLAIWPGLTSARFVIFGYLLVMASSSFIGRATTLPRRYRPVFPVAVATMHWSQGLGMIRGAISILRSSARDDPYRRRNLQMPDE